MKFRNKKTGEIKEWGPILINSALLSAQQRKRYYWTNWHVEQPEDKGILLKDVLESGITEREKTTCLTANIWKGNGANPLEYMQKHQGKPYCFEPVGAAMRTREDDNGKFKRLEVNGQEKSNAITSVQTDSMICEPMRIGTIAGTIGSQGSRIYSVRGKSVSLNANGGGGGAKTGLYKIDLPDGDYIVRKLTPVECERLQTLPDNYTAGISNTQRYKALGNGWTVDVIAHIFKQIPTEN